MYTLEDVENWKSRAALAFTKHTTKVFQADLYNVRAGNFCASKELFLYMYALNSWTEEGPNVLTEDMLGAIFTRIQRLS